MTSKTSPVFSCRGVRVFIGDKEVVKGVDLDIYAGERHALMGPNGSGKSTFAAAIAGHPAYRLEGEVFIDGERIDGLEPDERARRGLFLGFQHPVAIPGVSVASFLRAAVKARRGVDVPVREFRVELFEALDALDISRDFAGRSLNDGFSGGERKRLEILQLSLLEPRFALLDEIDSGLDIDALKVVSRGVREAVSRDTGLLLVTHYQRILNHIEPTTVHIFVDGRIARTGGPEEALELEAKGYEGFANAAKAAKAAATAAP
jgi:Fe-S cluster assembly ATP-binding protein